jgi:hypothetical protein
MAYAGQCRGDAVLGIAPGRIEAIIAKSRMCSRAGVRVRQLAASLPGATPVPYHRGDCAEPDPQLVAAIGALTPHEQTHLAALAWIGRGTYAPNEWEEALSEIEAAHNPTMAEYVASLPMLGESLEEGLAALAQERNLRLEGSA